MKSLRCHFDLADCLKPKREEFARFSKQLKDKDIKSLRLNSSQFIALLPRSLLIKPNTLYLPVYSLLRLPQTVQAYCMIFPSRNFLAINAKVYNIYICINTFKDFKITKSFRYKCSKPKTCSSYRRYHLTQLSIIADSCHL